MTGKGFIWLLGFMAFLWMGCEVDLLDNKADEDCGIIYPPSQEHRVTISQGVWGQVWFWEGDFMPTPCSGKQLHGTITAVKRELFIHEATTFDQVERTDSPVFFSAIFTPLIATVTSDSLGFFQITLPPGKYSFFVKEDSLFYANGVDDSHIMPVVVTADSVSKRQININYRAAF